MMQTQTALAAFVLIQLFAGQAHAWPWSHYTDCGYYQSEVWTLEKKIVRSVAPLCVFRPLKFSRVQKGALTVDAWIGGYTRDAVVTNTYRIDHFDRCSGVWEGAEHKNDTADEKFKFNIENPNLASDVTASYISNAPLTDSEAQAALPEARQRCEKLKPGLVIDPQ